MADDLPLGHVQLRRARAARAAINLFSGDGAIIDLVNLTVAVPLLIGVFWGATSVGREYDTGTNVLAWTQSVTRRHWLRGKMRDLAGVVGPCRVRACPAWSRGGREP